MELILQPSEMGGKLLVLCLKKWKNEVLDMKAESKVTGFIKVVERKKKKAEPPQS